MNWTENILVPSPRWGDSVTYAALALGTQSGVLIADDVLWRSAVPARPTYLPISLPENVCAAARHIHDACLRENRLARAQDVLYAHHIGVDGQVYRSDYDWVDLWEKPADR